MDTVEEIYDHYSDVLGRKVSVMVFISGRSQWFERPADGYLEGWNLNPD